MLFIAILLSFSLIGVSNAENEAALGAVQIMNAVQESYEYETPYPILAFLNLNFTYSMCGHNGNKENFKGYLMNQLNQLNELKLRPDFDNARVDENELMEVLKFRVDSVALYNDKSRIEGEATITAIRNNVEEHFSILYIIQHCRRTVKRHHRLYRLFTNENLYDYKK